MKTFYLFILSTFLFSFALSAQIEIIKKVSYKNPTFSIEIKNLDAPVKAKIINCIKISGWFNTTQKTNTDYHTNITRHNNELLVRITHRNGQILHNYKQNIGSLLKHPWLANRIVDEIIRRIFGESTGGICSSRIAFCIKRGKTKEIFTMDFDGSNLIQNTKSGGISVEPSWAPNGKFILYTYYGLKSTNTILLDVYKKKHKRLTNYKGLNSGAVFSPNGNWFAICLSKDKAIDLYLMTSNKSYTQRLTRNSDIEASPTWSPDGANLCFTSATKLANGKIGKPKLKLVSSKGGKIIPLFKTPNECVSPDWSKKSGKIVFSTRIDRIYQIGIIKPGEKTPKILDLGSGDWESPSWAPDGRHIICTRFVNNKKSLYIVDTWSSTKRGFKMNFNISLPAWSPLY